MLPVIALAGRPNVGKSTLFNCLTRTKDALVSNFSGLTRDRQYGYCKYKDKKFIIVDTGGIGVNDSDIDALMLKQSQQAFIEADIIFFMVDAKAGCIADDMKIAASIRKYNKPIVVLVNKSENFDIDVVTAEFQVFGFSLIIPISAAHNQGIVTILEKAVANIAVTKVDEYSAEDDINLAFIGRPNVGKSTLINRILGEERVLVYDMPGTTRDSIFIPFSDDTEQKYNLIDTAGIRRRGKVSMAIEKFSIIKTLNAIEKANVCLLLIDAKEGVTDQDLHLLGYILNAGKAIVILVNKWDKLDPDHKEQVKSNLLRKLTFTSFAKMKFISALHGSGVGLILKDVKQAFKSANKKMPTPMLTKLLQGFVAKNQPPLSKGRIIKLRYAHQGGSNPPVIIIHGNQVDKLPENYKRFLINSYIEELQLKGTPLKIEFKSSKNPFDRRK